MFPNGLDERAELDKRRIKGRDMEKMTIECDEHQLHCNNYLRFRQSLRKSWKMGNMRLFTRFEQVFYTKLLGTLMWATPKNKSEPYFFRMKRVSSRSRSTSIARTMLAYG